MFAEPKLSFDLKYEELMPSKVTMNLGSCEKKERSVKSHFLFQSQHSRLKINNSHCYFIRLNSRKKGTYKFCLPALLGIHRNSNQKELGTLLGKNHRFCTSKEDIWPPKNSNSMHGSKSAILAIFQTWPGWP